jgi:hypothetical protein
VTRITIDMGSQYEEPRRRIIAVVADVRDFALGRNPQPTMYELTAQVVDAANAADNLDNPTIWAVRTEN